MHGYYLLNFVPLSPTWRVDEEESLSAAFEMLDDHPWKPPEMRPDGQLWVDYEVDETTACAHVIAALGGGAEVGHARDTIPERTAAELWKRFRDLFSPDTRFFLGVGLGDSTYVFQQGAIAVDDAKAGCFCVIEND